MTERARRALHAVCTTLVPGGAPALPSLVAGRIAALPRAFERAALLRLLALLDTAAGMLLLAGVPRAFRALSTARRERVLRNWATSRLSLRRRAFQALKRLVTVVHYTAVDNDGHNAAWGALEYPGPLRPTPQRPRQIQPLATGADAVLRCEVVVVGSGAGGSVVAAELAAAGHDVVLLEKGGHYEARDFSQREGEMLERLYDGSGLRTTDDLGLLVLHASCLGGGTVINYATSLAPPDSLRAEWARAHGLSHFESASFSRSVMAVAERIAVNQDHSTPGTRDRILERGLTTLGWHCGPLARDVRSCPQDDACGYCGYGCPRDAKQSTLVTFLRDAVHHGARVVVGADVRRLTFARGRASGAIAIVDGRATLELRARTVVLAAGAVHSPALLLRSGVRHAHLGRHLTLHPATAVFGLMDEPVRPWTGALQTRYSEQFADLDAGYGFRFETAPLHPALFALAVPWESGSHHRERMAQLSRTALVGVLLRDRDGGRIRVDRHGEPVVTYRLSPYDTTHLRQGITRAAEVLEAAGAREIWAPAARWTAYRPGAAGAREEWLRRVDAGGYGATQMLLASFHQMASCRMGSIRRDSVVTPEHAVWDVPGLYVADASAFPSASGVNPMLTIMAMAHRAAGILKNR